jgi:hypothetical protein
MAGLRVVAPDSPSAWCEPGEVMVSAFCTGGGSSSPVTAYANGAKCGYGDSPARARILCLPGSAAAEPTAPAAPEAQPAAPAGQQGGLAPAAPDQAQAAGAPTGPLRVVAEGSNTASCEAGETLFAAYCSGGWDTYPLIAYPGGRVKCGYSGGNVQATAVCLAGGQAEALGLRVVASDTNTAWCESGEKVVSAYCTGGWSEYPLQTYPNGAKCGYSAGGSKATVICSAATADASGSGPLRLVSGESRGACEGDEMMVSAFCTGSSGSYPLQTYPGGAAKCGYSGGTAQVTLACLKR